MWKNLNHRFEGLLSENLKVKKWSWKVATLSLFLIPSFVLYLRLHSLVLLDNNDHHSMDTPDEMNLPLTATRLHTTTYLKVPFYVYDNELNWYNATIEGVPVSKSWYPTFKHSDDYWFLHSALLHPMRTMDPSHAKLFFVPTLINLNAETNRNFNSSSTEPTFCVHGRCSIPRTNSDFVLIRWANEVLGQSKYFQRSGGRDHIVVASHYDTLEYLEKPVAFRFLRKCAMVRFENFGKICFLGQKRCARILAKGPNPKRLRVDPIYLPEVSLPSMYVGTACPQQQQKTVDFAMVAFIEGKPTPIRQRICEWLQRGNYSFSLCGQGDQCPALSTAKYGFHARGDTFGSNRPIDTLLSGTVPLFTDEEQYRILPNFIPWTEISDFVNVSTYEAFSESLNRILRRSESVYDEKQRLINKYTDVLNYSSGVTFDWYMAEFATILGVQ
jgi:hypothetical protein